MEAVKEESNGSENSAKSKLRFPLRSATKAKDDKSVMADTASSTSKRANPSSSVSKSVSVLDISGKDKSAKPPRRLSVPAKPSISPLPRSTGKIPPISETRTKGTNKGKGNNGKTVSDVSKSTGRRKFSVLFSASYWLSQIKLSELAAKHSVSLGFFKLALESGCEPLQRMRDELKSYVHRHNLVGLEECLKELLISYNISDYMDQLQVSETCSQVPGEATQSSEGVHSSSSIDGGKKLNPKSKSLSSENVQASSVAEVVKRGGSPRKISASKNRGPVNRNSAKSNTVANIGGGNPQKKPQRPVKQLPKAGQTKTQNQGENFVGEKDQVKSFPVGETEQDDKENKNTQQPEEINLTEVVI